MRREEIEKSIQEELMSLARERELFGQNSGSTATFEEVFGRTGVMACLIYVVAYVIALKEWLFEDWKKEIDKAVLKSHYGTEAWWIERAKEWQYGDSTIVIDGRVGYRDVDESSRIIEAVAVRQSGRRLSLCVAKKEGGKLVALSIDELSAFAAYVEKVKPLGVSIGVYSDESAKVVLNASIKVDSESGSDAVIANVKTALNEYLSNLTFGSEVRVASVFDVVMDIEGVVDFGLEYMEIDGVVLVTDSDVIKRSYVPVSGYAELSESVRIIAE